MRTYQDDGDKPEVVRVACTYRGRTAPLLGAEHRPIPRSKLGLIKTARLRMQTTFDGMNHVIQRLPEIMAEFQMLLRTPTGLRDRLNDRDELDTFGQWRAGPGERMHQAVGEESHYDNQRMAFTTKKPYQCVNCLQE